MPQIRAWLLALSLAVSLPAGLAAESFTGASGLLQTPGTQVLAEGQASLSLNNAQPHLEAGLVFAAARSYAINLGIGPGLEVSGRLFDADFVEQALADDIGYRDLSLNAKFSLGSYRGVSIAVGALDLGGALQLLRSEYLVAQSAWRAFTFSAGYGRGPDVLRGLFGGLVWQPSPYAALLLEHDGRSTNAGLRWSTANKFDWLKLDATLQLHADRNDPIAAGLSLQFPLAGRPVSGSGVAPITPRDPLPELQAGISSGLPALDEVAQLAEALREAGFRAVAIGQQQDAWVLRLDSLLYAHSYRESLARAIALASRYLAGPPRKLKLILCTYQIPLLQVDIAFKAFPGTQAITAEADTALLQVRYVADLPEGVQWLTEPASSPPHWIWEPLLTTFVGTEYGNLDFSLSGLVSTVWPLAPGLWLSGGLEARLYRSADFRPGRNFHASGTENGIHHLLVQALIRSHPQSLSVLSAGAQQIGKADFGVLGLEHLWTTEEGLDQWRLKLQVLRNQRGTRGVLLAGYTRQFATRDIQLSASVGRFYAGDEGLRLDAVRFFGDTSVSLFYKLAHRGDQAAGLQLSLPLNPRGYQARWMGMQVAGARRWRHGLSSTVNNPDGINPLRPNLITEPRFNLDLRDDLFDAQRLSPADLRAHAEALGFVCTGPGC